MRVFRVSDAKRCLPCYASGKGRPERKAALSVAGSIRETLVSAGLIRSGAKGDRTPNLCLANQPMPATRIAKSSGFSHSNALYPACKALHAASFFLGDIAEVEAVVSFAKLDLPF